MHTKFSTLVTFKKLQEDNLVTIKNKNNISLNSKVRKQNTNKTRQRVQKVSQQKTMINPRSLEK
jgi:hypothetical protein